VQGAKPELSRAHWKLATPEPEPSSPLKSKEAEVEALGSGGPEVIVVCGGVASTVQVTESGVGSTFPRLSTARTANVCGPLPSPE
jgi:hypothetical protein